MHSGRARPAFVRIGAPVLAVALFAVLPSGVVADTEAELEAAKVRAAQLERQMASREAALADLDARVAALAARLSEARSALQETSARIAAARAAAVAAESRLRGLRSQLDRRVAAAYMAGPGTVVEMLLGAASLSDLHARMEFASRVIGGDADLLLQVRRRTVALERTRRDLARLSAEQAGRVAAIEREHADLGRTLEAQRRALSELVAARLEAIAAAEDLARRLRAERLAPAQKGPITFGAWAGHFLPRLGAPTCRANMILVVAWEVAEYTAARWNPLATTYDMPGATPFNGGGVRNYVSLDQGLRATQLTLGLPDRGYEPVVARLRACADPMKTADAIDRSAWCSCGDAGYVRRFVPPVAADYERFANARPPWS